MTAADRSHESQLPGGAFRRVCRQIEAFGCLEQALLVTDNELAVGDLGANAGLAEAAAVHTRRTCDQNSPAVQIQYAQLDGGGNGHLLYVMPVDDYLLVLVAASDTALGVLRHLAHRLAEALQARLAKDGRNVDGQVWATSRQPWRQNQSTFAIAWRPVEPLPLAMRKIIRESARRLSRQRGCQLHFIGVGSDHVHLVLECSRRRRGAWVAHAFKRGIEVDIARRYGTSAKLWQKGFLAYPSREPIGGEALLAYVNH
jgi:hypothetical protein